jgi:hypothetical protein
MWMRLTARFALPGRIFGRVFHRFLPSFAKPRKKRSAAEMSFGE